jgi:hypothetical protein
VNLINLLVYLKMRCIYVIIFSFFNCNDKVGRNFIKNAFAFPTLPLQFKKSSASLMQNANLEKNYIHENNKKERKSLSGQVATLFANFSSFLDENSVV